VTDDDPVIRRVDQPAIDVDGWTGELPVDGDEAWAAARRAGRGALRDFS
jgi:hypothetical protein